MKRSFLNSLFLVCSIGLTSLSGSVFGVEYLSDPEPSSTEYWQRYDDMVADYYDAFPSGQSSEIKMLEQMDINLIWLSKSIVEKNKYVFPELREKLEVAPYIKDWVAKGYKVKFWFDSLASTKSQVIETKKLFDSIEKSLLLEESRLELVDIWAVKSVQEKADFFKNKSGLVPIYLRADLIRLMISLDQINSGRQYSVYTDLDVKAVPVSNLMDKDQQELLKSVGMVVARGGVSLGMENAFHVVSNHENVAKALDLTIEANFERYEAKEERLKKDAGQQVYDAYPPMFRLLYHLQGLGTLKNTDGTTFDLVRDRKKAIDSFCTRTGFSSYNNYFTGHNGSFTWSEERSDHLTEIVRKDTLKDEMRNLEKSRRYFKVSYLPMLEELETLDLESRKIDSKIKSLKSQLDLEDSKWNDSLPKLEKEEIESQCELLEGQIRNLRKSKRQLDRKNNKLSSYQRYLVSLPKKYDEVSQLRIPNNGFKVPYMWIPKVTIDRPASKGSGYN